MNADWCDDCRGYTHSAACPSNTPLTDEERADLTLMALSVRVPEMDTPGRDDYRLRREDEMEQLLTDVGVIRDQLIPSMRRSGGHAYVETLERLLKRISRSTNPCTGE